MNVDFPAPFGPVRPYRRPIVNVVVTSSKSTFDPNRIETLLTEIMREKLWRKKTAVPQAPTIRAESPPS